MRRGTGSLENEQAECLFLLMTIRATALATLVVRHFSLTPFLDGTHANLRFLSKGQLQ